MTQERFFELVYAWKDGDLTGDELYKRVFILSNGVGQSEELNHDLKIGDKVVVTNRYVATISDFCADKELIEIKDGCDYKQVYKENVTKEV